MLRVGGRLAEEETGSFTWDSNVSCENAPGGTSVASLSGRATRKSRVTKRRKGSKRRG